MDAIDLDLGTMTIAHNPDTARIAAALFSEDDIGAVIRCHFEVERATTHAVSVITQDRWRVVKNCRYLADKLNLLEVIGVPKHFLEPARALNRHRNGLAHQGVDEITEDQETEITRLTRLVFPNYHDDFELRVSGRHTFNKKYRDCSTKERYVMTVGQVAMMIAGLPEILAKYYVEAATRHRETPS
ncbi:hypothetical protein [Mesorhizobium sp.]|uniref:hypothetical protein n=1 Tax=Mesorhizobium sp. TaxID=1871066 RepID=UPI003561F7E5